MEDGMSIVKRLHNQRPLSDQAFEAMNDKDHKTIDDMRNAAMEAAELITELVKALKPFVEIAETYNDYVVGVSVAIPMEIGDLRAARKAYEDSK
jgi:hypothetical protein